MKLKTNKAIKKRFKLSNPKKGVAKVEHQSQNIAHNISKRRQFRNFRSKLTKILSSSKQVKKVIKSLSN